MNRAVFTLVALPLSAAWLLAVLGEVAAGQEQSDNPVLQMVAGLLGESDRDMRALALQQVREELPGESVTKYFAGLLPELPPLVQAELIEALADRQDAAARPAVAAMLASAEPSVRVAAIRALGALGNGTDIPPLVTILGQGSQAERAAARQSLSRLKDPGANAALQAELASSAASVRAELLHVLAARNAVEAAPAMLRAAEDADPVVRLAALEALRLVAQPEHTATLVRLLPKLEGDAELRRGELALLAICSRGGPQCVEAIAESLSSQSVAVQTIALHALARAGGPEALKAVTAFLDNPEPALVDEAVRVLSCWPDRQAVDPLLLLVQSNNSRHKVLAFRGLARLGEPAEDRPADMETLSALAQLAQRVEEKRLLLAALGQCPVAEALTLAAGFLDDAQVAVEAGLAVVAVAESLPAEQRAAARPALEKVLAICREGAVCDRVRRLLGQTDGAPSPQP